MWCPPMNYIMIWDRNFFWPTGQKIWMVKMGERGHPCPGQKRGFLKYTISNFFFNASDMIHWSHIIWVWNQENFQTAFMKENTIALLLRIRDKNDIHIYRFSWVLREIDQWYMNTKVVYFTMGTFCLLQKICERPSSQF